MEEKIDLQGAINRAFEFLNGKDWTGLVLTKIVQEFDNWLFVVHGVWLDFGLFVNLKVNKLTGEVIAV